MPTRIKLLKAPEVNRTYLIIIGIVVFLLFLALIIFLLTRNKSEQSVQGVTDTNSEIQETEYIQLNLANFAQENDANPDTVNQKYMDKYIETQGYVSYISTEPNERPFVSIIHTKELYVGTSMQCTPLNDVTGIVHGDYISMKGQVTDRLMGVIELDNCRVAELESP